MNAWLSRQAVARLTDLLAVLAAVPHSSDEHRCDVHSGRSWVEELMPAGELLVLAGVLREATSCTGLSAATRADCWSWSSYLERLLLGGPTTVTAMTTPPAGQARPERNVVLVPRVDRDSLRSRRTGHAAPRDPRGKPQVTATPHRPWHPLDRHPSA